MELPQLKKEFLSVKELADRWTKLTGNQVTEDRVIAHGEDGSLMFMVDKNAISSSLSESDSFKNDRQDWFSWVLLHPGCMTTWAEILKKRKTNESLIALFKQMPFFDSLPISSPYNAFAISAAQLSKLKNNNYGMSIGELLGEDQLLERFLSIEIEEDYPLFLARRSNVGERNLVISMDEVNRFEAEQEQGANQINKIHAASNRIKEDPALFLKRKPRLPDYISPEEIKKQNKTPTISNKQKSSKQEKREQVLSQLIAGKGKEKLVLLKRIGVWQALTEIDKPLFPPRTSASDSTVKKFFDNQPLIAFERGR